MQFKKSTGLALLACCLVSGSEAFAQTPRFSIAANVGKTLESLEIPSQDGVNISNSGEAAFGLNVGYLISDSLSVELEVTKGSVESSASGPGGALSIETKIDTFAIYATQRTQGDLYFKSKLGILNESLSVTGIAEDSDIGLSYGLGGGYRFQNNLSIEAEYVKVEEDIGWLFITGRFLIGQ